MRMRVPVRMQVPTSNPDSADDRVSAVSSPWPCCHVRAAARWRSLTFSLGLHHATSSRMPIVPVFIASIVIGIFVATLNLQ